MPDGAHRRPEFIARRARAYLPAHLVLRVVRPGRTPSAEMIQAGWSPTYVLMCGAVIPFGLVWLRAAGLIGQALAFGGVVFALFVVRSAGRQATTDALDPPRVLIVAGALLTAVAQAATLVLLIVSFSDDSGWPVVAVLWSTVGIVGLVRIVAARVAAWGASTLRGSTGSRVHDALLLGTTALLPATGALVGHATDRLDGGIWLMLTSALHQAAAGAWVGGLVCAAALAVRTDLDQAGAWLGPCSGLAVVAVMLIALTGIALSFVYVGTPAAAVGTSYGSTVLTKVTLFVVLLFLGVLNHRALHGGLALGGWRWPRLGAGGGGDSAASATPWRRRVEVEAGLALVTVFLAASISSAPPATDVGVQPVTLAEIRSGLTPRWPRFETPSVAELAAAAGLGDPDVPRTAEDITWSEFGHNVSGVFVVVMGVLAMLERTGHAPWARHWPLLIIALSGFVAWSLDPEGWQTGVVGFWTQLWSPEILQHRIMLAL